MLHTAGCIITADYTPGPGQCMRPGAESPPSSACTVQAAVTSSAAYFGLYHLPVGIPLSLNTSPRLTTFPPVIILK